MKFGEVYNFRYKSVTARDKNPKVIVMQETEDRIYGINLNLVPSRIKDQIILLFNNEIFKNFSFDDEMVQEAQRRQKEINERLIMSTIIANNRDTFEKGFATLKKVSKTTLFSYMTISFRVYDKKKIEKSSKIII